VGGVQHAERQRGLVGEPLALAAYRGRTGDAAVLREVTALIMGRVRDLLAEVREEPAPQEFYRRETA